MLLAWFIVWGPPSFVIGFLVVYGVLSVIAEMKPKRPSAHDMRVLLVALTSLPIIFVITMVVVWAAVKADPPWIAGVLALLLPGIYIWMLLRVFRKAAEGNIASTPDSASD